MAGKNKFGFDDLTPTAKSEPRVRSLGPMGSAVREAATSLQETTETKIEQRRLNASEAKEYRAAVDDGLVLVKISLEEILTSDLPRDRLDLEQVAASHEMEELISSIRERGQREPIEVFPDETGGYQLKKGWRRLTALRHLHSTTGDEAFGVVVARVAPKDEDRTALYIDMVEENIIREDLSFAEMAQLAITASKDDSAGLDSAEMAVARLYSSLHKMKRSYVRSFVYLLEQLGDVLQWPKAISRNLGVEVSRKLRADSADLGVLRAALEACGNEEDQLAVLTGFVAVGAGDGPVKKSKPAKQKFEFHVGSVKVTARNGECRIVAQRDYTDVPKEMLERAVRAFEEVLK